MMTLDEAIEHCKELAAQGDCNCSLEHGQLLKWLKELREIKNRRKMNELANIQLFRIGATMPWAEVETTQHNIRLTHYEGAQEDAKKTVLVISRDEAIDIAKALKVLADNYCYNGKEEDEL